MTARAITVALALVCCGCAPAHKRPPAKPGGVAIGTHADSSVFVEHRK